MLKWSCFNKYGDVGPAVRRDNVLATRMRITPFLLDPLRSVRTKLATLVMECSSIESVDANLGRTKLQKVPCKAPTDAFMHLRELGEG